MTQESNSNLPQNDIFTTSEVRPIALASKGRRFGTYIVDYVCILLFSNFVGKTIGVAHILDLFLFSFFIFTVYYLFFEGIWARTPGKLFFGTAVITETGEAPPFGQIFERTLYRGIPFEAFSFLGTRGWHDHISNTHVVSIAHVESIRALDHSENTLAKEKDVEGLGGWLVIVALVIIFMPLYMAVANNFYLTYFSSESWTLMNTPGTGAYNLPLAVFVVAVAIITCTQILAWIFLAILFFSKKRIFPKFFIGILIFSLLFTLAYPLAFNAVAPGGQLYGPDALKDLGLGLFIALAGLPYIRVSKRVKATFVR